ncbi:Uncharacterised protein (plasmid) [Mycoplasmopsis maculosa]|uniref:Uncharacterized protein n=1 Tax=Mycoplasmopsis maculosa TaxID=114885 RepID=A0A449B3Z8_9BACT|nr:hypothetical protein [Mycoplasmopsis maculosa]VEU75216.1 Uncharacterised protein [Mycoplasmopsis maculosa]VEU75306.1 Uncharacterised protein [Mycoplasmopsis maculosa]VEU75837.1 Uncharacterised protein [Mycoplasmopsis maculosa]
MKNTEKDYIYADDSFLKSLDEDFAKLNMDDFFKKHGTYEEVERIMKSLEKM